MHRRNRRDTSQRGAVLVEFALSLPVLLTLVIAGAELARFVLLQQRLDRASTTVADLATRSQTLSTNDVNNIMAAAGHLMAPFDVIADGRVVLTLVEADAQGDPVIAWQTSSGDLAAASRVGSTVGTLATIPEPSLVTPNAALVIGEVMIDYRPVMGLMPAAQVLYRQATYRPRLSASIRVVP